MKNETCGLSNNPLPEETCKTLFDEKTTTRLKREDEQTWKGLRNCKRIFRKEILASCPNEEDEKEEIDQLLEGETKEVKHYRFTERSKLKIRRAIEQKKKWEEYFSQYRKCKFFTPLLKLRTTLLRQEWHRSCHSKERMAVREKIRLQNVLSIKYEQNVDVCLPMDHAIFDKMIEREREKQRQLKFRRERMVKIVERIASEMKNGIRLSRKPRLKRISGHSFAEASFEGLLSTSSEDETLLAKKISLNEKSEICPNEEEKDSEQVEAEEETITSEEDLVKYKKLPELQSSTEQVFPKDACFYATPNVVFFEHFKPNKVYSRKVTITNKTSKWAYIRFRKVYSNVWEPGVVEIETMDAARVKPGLCIPVTVKFSPAQEEEVRADVCFLTLNADDEKSFREFRIPVCCTPDGPLPITYPKELRFRTAPIWKYSDTEFGERILTISNSGGKSFSVLIEERNESENYFLWHFDQAQLQSVCSIVWSESESRNSELRGENSQKTYRIEVPSRVECKLRISFKPRYVGLHHEVMSIWFIANEKIFGKQDVPIWAEVIGSQIHLDPPCIDLGIAMIDCDVCQQTFNVVNTGRTIVEISSKTPKCLKDQVSIYPRSTIVQPETSSKVSVRLTPESNIKRVCKRFYDSISSILEFPVQVQIHSRDKEKPPPLILKVLASLTTRRGLTLEPTYANLGLVYTHESVYTELTLTNESLSSQEYAFVNLPPTVEVQPNYGFGTILPGESIMLHLIYSPCSKDIPGNEIGANGLSGERSFFVHAVTLAELVGNRQQRSIINELTRQTVSGLKMTKNRGLPPPVPINFTKCEKTTEQTDDEVEENLENTLSRADADFAMSEEDICVKEEISNAPMPKSGHPDKREDKSIMEVSVFIVDTFCEFSEQVIEFPTTPCGSFSKVSVHLRAFNVASYPNCTCGIIKNQKKKLTASYELKTSSDRVKIRPHAGVFKSSEFVDVELTFKPRLPNRLIFEEGRRLKMNVELQEKMDKNEKKGNSKKATKIGESKTSAPDVDRFAGEINLLETFEPCVSTIFLTCKLLVEMEDGKSRSEVLFAKLICPVAKPEIVVLNENREILFGSSPIGAPSTRYLLVKNISSENVKIQTSLLNPFGPFFVPPGKTIETGSVLKLPVTYQPVQNQDEDHEYFEVSSPRSKTRWSVKLSGHGVMPSYVLRPKFRVARFKASDGKAVELPLSMQNTGQCPLTFRLCIMGVLEGEIAWADDKSLQKPNERKKKVKAESSKITLKAEYDDELRPNEELAIFDGSLRQSADHSRFSLWNLNENMQLFVPEKKKVDFGVRFNSGTEEIVSGQRETTVTSRETKKKSNEIKASNYCHVAHVKLTFGSATVQDFLMICSTT